jgi:carbonic anhydrase
MLLEGNRDFIDKEFQRHLDYYQTIAQAQTPQVLWIGCSDSRVSEHVITNSKPGTIFVHRNVANIVAFNDINVAAIIEYAVEYLKIPDIIICGHTKCGGIAALHDGNIEDHYISDWLLIANGAKESLEQIDAGRKLSRDERLNILIEENVKLQIKHLQALSIIKHRRPPHVVPRIHGLVYDVETGHLRVLVDGKPRG